MSSFNRRESAEWSISVATEAERLQAAVDKALAEAAGRGFPAPPGETLEGILTVGQDTKGKLVEIDGKIYEERRSTLFQQQEFALKVLVQIGKLAFELYREQIFNALALEQSQTQATIERRGADVERQNAETEFRQVAIINQRAAVEQSIITFRQQLVDAEYTSMAAEKILIQAQLATAEKKLEIIASIYQVIAAEQLVLAANQRRATALQKVLVARQALAEIKLEEVPLYQEKATARLAMADAITKEIPVREAIERLGYDRIDLKTTEEYAGHLERESQFDLELALESEARAETALHLAQAQSRRVLEEYRNTVESAVLTNKRLLQEYDIDFRLYDRLERETIRVDNEIELLDHERSNLSDQLSHLLTNMEDLANDLYDRIFASADRIETSVNTSITTARTIYRGS